MTRSVLIAVIALIVGAGLMYAIPSGWRMRTVALIVPTVGKTVGRDTLSAVWRQNRERQMPRALQRTPTVP